MQIIDNESSLVFFDNCVETIFEFESFRYNKNKEYPINQADHSISACRYGLGFLLIQEHMKKQSEKRKENCRLLYA